MTSSKVRGSEMVEDGCELSLGSTDGDNEYYSRDKSYLMDTETAGTVEAQQRGKRCRSKKPKLEESVNNHLDDIKEACSGTEEGQNMIVVKGKFGMEIADEKIPRFYSKGSRKRSKKVLFKRGTSTIGFGPILFPSFPLCLIILYAFWLIFFFFSLLQNTLSLCNLILIYVIYEHACHLPLPY